MKTNVVALTFVLLVCHCVAFGQEGEAAPAPTPEDETVRFTPEEEDALVEAIRGGDVATVRRFLDEGMSPNARFGDGEEVFSYAVRKGQVKIAAAMLERAARHEREERPDLEDALRTAVGRVQPKMVRLLLSHGADAKAGDGEGHTSLLAAAISASVADWPPEALTALFDGEDEEDDSNRHAPKADRFEILRMLIDGGADLNAGASDCGLSPLTAAAAFGSPEVARLLLERGADPNVGRKEWNPLYLATAGSEKFWGVDRSDDAQEQAEIYLLFYASAQGRAEVAALLRKAGAREQWQWPEEKDEGEPEGNAAGPPEDRYSRR